MIIENKEYNEKTERAIKNSDDTESKKHHRLMDFNYKKSKIYIVINGWPVYTEYDGTPFENNTTSIKYHSKKIPIITDY